jgi:hypothetical protein
LKSFSVLKKNQNMFVIKEINDIDFTISVNNIPHLEHIFELKFFLKTGEEIMKPDKILIYDNNNNNINLYKNIFFIEYKKNNQLYYNNLHLFNINSFNISDN